MPQRGLLGRAAWPVVPRPWLTAKPCWPRPWLGGGSGGPGGEGSFLGLCVLICAVTPHPPTTTYHHTPSVLCVNTQCVMLLLEPFRRSFHFPQRRDQAPYTELVGPFRSNSNYHFCSRPHIGNTLQALEDPYASHKGQDGHSSKLCHTSFSFPENPFLAIYTWKAPTHPSKPSSPDILGKPSPSCANSLATRPFLT